MQFIQLEKIKTFLYRWDPVLKYRVNCQLIYQHCMCNVFIIYLFIQSACYCEGLQMNSEPYVCACDFKLNCTSCIRACRGTSVCLSHTDVFMWECAHTFMYKCVSKYSLI